MIQEPWVSTLEDQMPFPQGNANLPDAEEQVRVTGGGQCVYAHVYVCVL